MDKRGIPGGGHGMEGGVTLIELMVVFTIIMILASMLLTAVNVAMERGDRALCELNQRQADVYYYRTFDGEYFYGPILAGPERCWECHAYLP